MKATIYHNARCSKSRETFALLEQHGVEPEVIEYLKTPPSQELLEDLLEKLNMEACEIVRTKESFYKEQYDGRMLSNEECIRAMIENPILIERPIVVVGDTAVVGRPPENVLQLLKK